MDHSNGGTAGPRIWGTGTDAGPIREENWLTVTGLGAHHALALARSGHRFIVFPHCISVGIITVKRMSAVHVVPPGDGTGRRAMRYVLGSLAFGWWGIPWGPIWTVTTVFRSLRGGIDVTEEVAAAARAEASRTVAGFAY